VACAATLACAGRTILEGAAPAQADALEHGAVFMGTGGRQLQPAVSATAEGYAGWTDPDGMPLAVRNALARVPWAEAALRTLGVRASLGPKEAYRKARRDFSIPEGRPGNATAVTLSADGVFSRAHVAVFGQDLPHGRWDAAPDTADLLTHEAVHVAFDFLSRRAKDAVLDAMKRDGKWLAGHIVREAKQPGSPALLVSACLGLPGLSTGTGGHSLAERILRRRLAASGAMDFAATSYADPRKNPVFSSPEFESAWRRVGATLTDGAGAAPSRNSRPLDVWHTPESEPHYWLLAVHLAHSGTASAPAVPYNREEFIGRKCFEDECIAHFVAATLSVDAANHGKSPERRGLALAIFGDAERNAAKLATDAPAALRRVARQADIETRRSGDGHAAALSLLRHALRQRGLSPELTDSMATVAALRDGIAIERASFAAALAARGGNARDPVASRTTRERASEWTLASAQMTRLFACGTGPMTMPLDEVREACETLVRWPHICMALDLARMRAEKGGTAPDLFVDTLLAGQSIRFDWEMSSGTARFSTDFAQKALMPDHTAKYRKDVAGIFNSVRARHTAPDTGRAVDAVAAMTAEDWEAMAAGDPRGAADGLLAAVWKLHADIDSFQTPLAEALLHASLQVLASFSENAARHLSWRQIGPDRMQDLQDTYLWARKSLHDAGFGWAADCAHQKSVASCVEDVIGTASDGAFLAHRDSLVSAEQANDFMRHLDADVRRLRAQQEHLPGAPAAGKETEPTEYAREYLVDNHSKRL
jgi:hypothetical protein